MIGIFDSGIGGLGIFEEIRKLMSSEQILYLADTKNCPYGEKSEQQIKQICLKNSRFLINMGANIIVVACNTASTVALKYIRDNISLNQRNNQLYSASIKVVGVVPVVKTCSEVSKNKRIGILATKRTVKSDYLKDLVEKYCPSQQGFKIFYQAANELVELVESNKLTSLPAGRQVTSNKEISKYLQLFIDEKVDVVALGCTHFPFLKKQIQEIMGKGVMVLDSNGAVARQVCRIVTSGEVTPVVEQSSLRGVASNKVDNNKKYRFYTSGDEKVLKNQITNLIRLDENDLNIREKPAEPAL